MKKFRKVVIAKSEKEKPQTHCLPTSKKQSQVAYKTCRLMNPADMEGCGREVKVLRHDNPDDPRGLVFIQPNAPKAEYPNGVPRNIFDIVFLDQGHEVPNPYLWPGTGVRQICGVLGLEPFIHYPAEKLKGVSEVAAELIRGEILKRKSFLCRDCGESRKLIETTETHYVLYCTGCGVKRRLKRKEHVSSEKAPKREAVVEVPTRQTVVQVASKPDSKSTKGQTKERPRFKRQIKIGKNPASR